MNVGEKSEKRQEEHEYERGAHDEEQNTSYSLLITMHDSFDSGAFFFFLSPGYRIHMRGAHQVKDWRSSSGQISYYWYY